MVIKKRPLIPPHVWILAMLTLGLASYLGYRLVIKERHDHRISMEKAYFYGQQNAIKGDIRIATDSTGKWVWLKSPWDDGKKPSYIP